MYKFPLKPFLTGASEISMVQVKYCGLNRLQPFNDAKVKSFYQSTSFLANCSRGGLGSLLFSLRPECLGSKCKSAKLGTNQRVFDQEYFQNISRCAGQQRKLKKISIRIKTVNISINFQKISASHLGIMTVKDFQIYFFEQ